VVTPSQVTERPSGSDSRKRSPYQWAAQIFERWTPGATVFAVLLTIIVLIAALIFTDATFVSSVQAWGDGLSGLHAFITQIALALFLGHMLAHTRPVHAALEKIFEIPNTAAQAYVLVFLASVGLTMLQWALGLVAGAILAKGIATSAARRGLRVDFPLLIAAAYSAFVVAGMAYNGTIPLTSASSGSFVEEFLGQTVPLTETAYVPYNLIALVLFVALVPVALHFVRPRNDAEIEVLDLSNADESAKGFQPETPDTPASWLESKPYINIALGLLLVVYLVIHFVTNGFDLSLDIVNWAMLAGIMLFSRSIKELGWLVKNATGAVGDVLLQFPLYAGILGIATGTGLITVLSDAFISISTPETLPIFGFISACIVNMAVPSAGGQFAVQGPIMLQASENLGVDPGLMIMSISYGDSLTNMIQPFFALPLLAIAGLGVRSIFKYTFVTFIVGLVIFLGILTMWSFFPL
jgi:short-chain fatty acids transporter